MAINVALEDMYYEDKEDRVKWSRGELSTKDINAKDVIRVSKLDEMLNSSLIDLNEIWNLHYAALIYQHSNDIEKVKLAHEFCKKAVDMGSNVTKWLFKATLDRYLLMSGQKQKFGTQYNLKNKKKL